MLNMFIKCCESSQSSPLYQPPSALVVVFENWLFVVVVVVALSSVSNITTYSNRYLGRLLNG